MAWTRLRKRRSSKRLVAFSDRGEVQASSPGSSGGPESGDAVRLIWPGTNGAAAARAPEARPAPRAPRESRTSRAPRASGAGEPGEVVAAVAAADSAAQPADGAADQDDLPFWDWSSDQSELDDPSDAFAPDRPEYPDGPDYYPGYRAPGGTDAPGVAPASRGTRESGGASGSGGATGSGSSAGSGESRTDRGLRRPREPLINKMAAQADEPRHEGIGQHLGNLAHLSADPRMRAWQWRAAIAIVIVVGFAIWGPWQWGLTVAVLAVIADTIIRSRRVLVGPNGVQRFGAQRHTSRQLRKLERAGYRAVHNARIAGSDDQVDHLVIGPAGVFAIDSEAWDKRLPVRTRNARQLWLGPFSMKERLEHARWESERAAAQLSAAAGTQVTVRPVMAVYGPKIHWDVATIRDVDVFSGPRLRRYLRSVARRADARLLSDGEIERLDKAAQTAFPQAHARWP